MRSTILYLSITIYLFACQYEERRQSELVWNQSFYQIGSQSSPRASDLNGDGVLDIVMGAGTAEMAETDHGVIALDGNTGELLWKQSASASIVGSATFYDITGDHISDVFIGGRGQNLMALNGQTGEIIWKYTYEYEDDPILQYARYNFYNSALVPDQNGDGFPELVAVNGGNWGAAPNMSEGRFPGVLMLLDSKTGNILAADTMPDGKESYMSPICFSQPENKEINILFGTGGETMSGNLYVTNLSDLKTKRLSSAKAIATEIDHGFIAPPVIVDITEDGTYDIVAISHASGIIALNGKDYQPIWKHAFPGMECSNALAVGHFNKEKTPDFLATMSKGTWPNNTIAQQVVLDGKSGKIEFIDSIGCFTLASPAIYDLNGDGYDEAIISKNEYDCSKTVADETEIRIDISNTLIYIDFRQKAIKTIDQMKGFKNFYSTPWIGDLDQDNYLDMVYTRYVHAGQIAQFWGMEIKCIATPVKTKDPIEWGSYMGSKGDGLY